MLEVAQELGSGRRYFAYHVERRTPVSSQEEILRINDEAPPQALQIALLVPFLVSVLGLGFSFRMMRLPDPAPSTAAERAALG